MDRNFGIRSVRRSIKRESRSRTLQRTLPGVDIASGRSAAEKVPAWNRAEGAALAGQPVYKATCMTLPDWPLQ